MSGIAGYGGAAVADRIEELLSFLERTDRRDARVFTRMTHQQTYAPQKRLPPAIASAWNPC